MADAAAERARARALTAASAARASRARQLGTLFGPRQVLGRGGNSFVLPAKRSQLLLCRCPLVCQALDGSLGAGNQCLGFPRIPQKLALPLQVSTRTGHHPGKTEAPCQFLGFERGLPGLALDPGQFLLDHTLRRLALRQALDLLAPCPDLRRTQ